MLASQILQDVRRELVETSAQYWSDAELLRHLNRGELDFVNKTRILEDTAQLSLVEGRLDYSLPANWVSARLVLHKIENSDGTFTWSRLYPSNLEKIAQQSANFLNTESVNRGRPIKYWIWNRSLWLDKAPNSDHDTTLYLFYKSKPSALTSSSQSINIDDSLSEALIAYILWKAWTKENELEKASAQQLIYDRYVAEGRRWVKKQSGDQRYRIDLDSPVPFEGYSNSFDFIQ